LPTFFVSFEGPTRQRGFSPPGGFQPGGGLRLKDASRRAHLIVDGSERTQERETRLRNKGRIFSAGTLLDQQQSQPTVGLLSDPGKGAAAGRAGCDAPKKTEGAANLRSLLRGLYPPPGTCQTYAYWLSGLNTRMPASVFEQAPKGSTRTTPSSSAQKPRIPVWLIVIGTARAV